MNIPYAYADLRFNPSFDKTTATSPARFSVFRWSIRMANHRRTQMLNKKGGAFNVEDESRLKAFTAQISIALENASFLTTFRTSKTTTSPYWNQ